MNRMNTPRRAVLLAAAVLACVCSPARAQFPERPVRLLVGFSAGSISDATARLLAEQVQDELGQPMVVENVPGAGATLAAARAAKSPADGYTLLFAAMGHAVAPALYKKLPYDTLNDFVGVATVADARVMLVTRPQSPFSTLGELVAAAKARPGQITYGSSGNGTFLHLIGESMAQTTGTQLLHVPFRAGAEAVTGVIAGNIDLAFCTVNTCAEQIKAGKVKPLGFVARARHPLAPSVPTFIEQGVAFDVGSYNYVLAPAGTPAPVLAKLHAAIDKVVRSAAFRKKTYLMGLDPMPSDDADAVTALVKSGVERWGKVVKSIGLKID